MMPYVLNMISYVISSCFFTCTFHMKNINQSYIISYLSDGYEILCNFICFLAPARAGSKAAPILFKCTLVRAWFESHAASASPLRLSVLFGFAVVY